RGAGCPRPCRGGRPLAGAGAARRARPVRRARDAVARRRDGAGSGRPGSQANESRREPAVRDRRRRDPAHGRGAAERDALGRDGAEGGRRAPRRARRDVRVRRPVGARPARVRGARAAPDLTAGVLPGAERRLGAGRTGAAGASRAAAAARVRPGRVRAPAQGARPLGRARRRRRPRGCQGRAGSARRAGGRARRAALARAAAQAVGDGRGMTLYARAPGKTNLCLFLGGIRADGLHELVSVIEPLSLADELTLEPLPGGALVAAAPGAGDMGCAAGADEVVCAGVEGPNLAGEALAAYRAASGWEGAPLRLAIVKRVPVAAGMGGGSGDAAAALRLVAHAAGRSADPLIAQL